MAKDISSKWQIDRHIPVGTLIAIGVQTLAFAYFLGGVSQRVADLERRGSEVVVISQQLQGVSERLARAETRSDNALTLLGDVKDRIKELREDFRRGAAMRLGAFEPPSAPTPSVTVRTPSRQPARAVRVQRGARSEYLWFH